MRVPSAAQVALSIEFKYLLRPDRLRKVICFAHVGPVVGGEGCIRPPIHPLRSIFSLAG